MGSFGPGLGSVVVSYQQGNIQTLKGCDNSMMILSTGLFGFIHHMVH